MAMGYRVAAVLAASVCVGSLLAAGPLVSDPAATSTAGQGQVAPAPPPADARGIAFFETHIRPLLVDHCYKCHSAKVEKPKGNLLLDSREGWQKGGDLGPAIVAGDPEKSLLIKAVLYETEGLKMPPNGKLPPRQIELLQQWVKMGAPDPRTGGSAVAQKGIDMEAGRKHWAFQPLRRTDLPAVKNVGWVRTPIDRFVLTKLEEKGITPNGDADRRRLIRRASLDLTGLPPAPEEVDAFVADTSPKAWEKVVDRLLASPHYGERWARHWLDLARFAESHGYEHDYDRPTAYHYRDFVIKALNADLPYDTFVRWQLAGDEIAPDNPLANMATGFLAAGTHSTQITMNTVEKERYDELDDKLSTAGTAFLGLTFGCARCHDHKFDPIPTHDYYRMLATFTTTVRSEVELNLEPEKYAKELAAFQSRHAPLVDARTRYENEVLPERFEKWRKGRSASAKPSPWVIFETVEARALGGTTFLPLDDGSLLASGPNPNHNTYTFVVQTHHPDVAGIRIEALVHESLKKNGPGRAANGNFALSDLRVTAAPMTGPGKLVEVKLVRSAATFEQKGLPVQAAIDGDPKSAWAVDPEFGKDHAAAFAFAKPLGFSEGTTFTITLKFENNVGHAIGRPRLSFTTAKGALDPRGAAVRQPLVELDRLLGMPKVDRSALLHWFRHLDGEWQRLRAVELAHAQQAPRPTLTKALICSEGLPAVRLHTQGADFFAQTYFLHRGDTKQKRGVAEPGFLQVLMPVGESGKRWQVSPPPGWRTSYRRTGFANWITDVDHGAGSLLARVIVNRLWQHHLGRGIVATPSDFGTQGERPTHPELLDWLAAELIGGGWKLKPLHKLILTSSVYMQDVQLDDTRRRHDPDNKLLSRFQRRRLEAEAVRDCILAVSGTLDRTLFGPGSLEEGHKRRSIYFTVKRSKLIPMMVVFDGPDALQGLGVRPVTTVAPQALLLLNNEQVRSAAAAFARRVAPDVETTEEDAVRRAYRIALARLPEKDELANAVDFLKQQTQEYARAGRGDAVRLALTDFCQVLFSLNEFLYVE